MRKISIKLFALVLSLVAGSAIAQIQMPMPSPAGSVSSTIGLTEVSVEYFRPKMKGRKIFGSGDDFLVPFGKIWRSGANSGTIVNFSSDVKVEGKDLAAGEYMLLTIPGADEWTVIFYKDKSIGGNVAAHKEENEALRVTAKSGKLSETVQTLTFNVTDLSDDGKLGALELAWENTSVKVGIAADFDAAVMASIEKNTQVNPGNYLRAAEYYMQTGRDLDQALAWVDMYLNASEANGKQFWNIYIKAQILAKKGDKKATKEVAKQGIELAKAYPNGDFGYIKRYEELIKSL